MMNAIVEAIAESLYHAEHGRGNGWALAPEPGRQEYRLRVANVLLAALNVGYALQHRDE